MGTLTTKQNHIAKLSQKETRFFKNVLHKESTVPEHSVFHLMLQHSSIDIHIKTVTFIKNISIFSKRPISLEHLPPCLNTVNITCVKILKKPVTLTISPTMLKEKHNTPPWQLYLSLVHCPRLSDNSLVVIDLRQNILSRFTLRM